MSALFDDSETTGGVPVRLYILLLLPLVLACMPSGVEAQTVEGRLVDRSSGEPVQGAMVLLMGGEEEVHSGFLSDRMGRFSLRAPQGGHFTIRAELIGFRTVSAQIELERGRTLAVELFTEAAPLALEGIVVTGSGRCLVRPDEGQRVARVWNEARKALLNQEWSSRGGFLRYRVVHYRKEMDSSGRPAGEETRLAATLVGQTPIRSLPALDLSTGGYIRQERDGEYRYYGPDARVLLSDAFLDTHCFRLVEAEDDPKLIGLAFHPIRDHRHPDIEGTFWLERESGSLRLLTYGYTGTPWSEAQGVAGGRVEFESLPTGAWVIRRWWIRMPIMVMDQGIRALGGVGLRVGGLVEEGGEVLRVALLEGGRIVDRVTSVTPTPE